MNKNKSLSIFLILATLLQPIQPIFAQESSSAREGSVNILRNLYQELQTRRDESGRSLIGFDFEEELWAFERRLAAGELDATHTYDFLLALESAWNGNFGSSSAEQNYLFNQIKNGCSDFQRASTAFKSSKLDQHKERETFSYPSLKKHLAVSAAWSVAMVCVWSLVYFGAFSCAPPATCEDGSPVDAESYLNPFCGECESYGFYFWGPVCKKSSIQMSKNFSDPTYNTCVHNALTMTAGFGAVTALPLAYTLGNAIGSGARTIRDRIIGKSRSAIPQNQEGSARNLSDQLASTEQKIKENLRAASSLTGISRLSEIIEEIWIRYGKELSETAQSDLPVICVVDGK